jgi:hypothetical protein
LLYLLFVTTGLRKGELASLTVADVVLDDARRLPALLAGPAPDAEPMKATGTDAAVALVPLLVLESGRAVPRQSVGDNCAGRGDCVVIDASPAPGTTSGGKAGKTEGWLTGLEPATPRITI